MSRLAGVLCFALLPAVAAELKSLEADGCLRAGDSELTSDFPGRQTRRLCPPVRRVMEDKRQSNLWIINFDGTEHRPLTTGKYSDTLRNGRPMDRN